MNDILKSYIPTPEELSKEDIAAARLLLARWLQAARPDLDLSPGSVFGDLVLNPAALMFAAQGEGVDRILSDIVLRNPASGVVYNCEFLASYLENFTRNKSLLRSFGVVRFVSTTGNLVNLDVGTSFSGPDNKLFQVFRLHPGDIRIRPVGSPREVNKNDFNWSRTSEDRYFVDIPLFGEGDAVVQEGADFEIGDDSMVGITVTALHDFYTPSQIGTVAQSVENARSSYLSVSWNTRSSSERAIKYYFPEIDYASAVLTGDKEMVRDKENSLGLPRPTLDIYPRSSLYGSTMREVFRAVYFEPDDSFSAKLELAHHPLWIKSIHLPDSDIEIPFTSYCRSKSDETPLASAAFGANMDYWVAFDMPRDITSDRPLIPLASAGPIQYQNMEVVYYTDILFKTVSDFVRHPDNIPLGVSIYPRMPYPLIVDDLRVGYTKKRATIFDRRSAATNVSDAMSSFSSDIPYSDYLVGEEIKKAGAHSLSFVQSDARLRLIPTTHILTGDMPETLPDVVASASSVILTTPRKCVLSPSGEDDNNIEITGGSYLNARLEVVSTGSRVQITSGIQGSNLVITVGDKGVIRFLDEVPYISATIPFPDLTYAGIKNGRPYWFHNDGEFSYEVSRDSTTGTWLILLDDEEILRSDVVYAFPDLVTTWVRPLANVAIINPTGEDNTLIIESSNPDITEVDVQIDSTVDRTQFSVTENDGVLTVVVGDKRFMAGSIFFGGGTDTFLAEFSGTSNSYPVYTSPTIANTYYTISVAGVDWVVRRYVNGVQTGWIESSGSTLPDFPDEVEDWITVGSVVTSPVATVEQIAEAINDYGIAGVSAYTAPDSTGAGTIGAASATFGQRKQVTIRPGSPQYDMTFFGTSVNSAMVGINNASTQLVVTNDDGDIIITSGDKYRMIVTADFGVGVVTVPLIFAVNDGDNIFWSTDGNDSPPLLGDWYYAQWDTFGGAVSIGKFTDNSSIGAFLSTDDTWPDMVTTWSVSGDAESITSVVRSAATAAQVVEAVRAAGFEGFVVYNQVGYDGSGEITGTPRQYATTPIDSLSVDIDGLPARAIAVINHLNDEPSLGVKANAHYPDNGYGSVATTPSTPFSAVGQMTLSSKGEGPENNSIKVAVEVDNTDDRTSLLVSADEDELIVRSGDCRVMRVTTAPSFPTSTFCEYVGQSLGKPNYENPDGDLFISWQTLPYPRWSILFDPTGEILYSTEDVEYPHQVVNWQKDGTTVELVDLSPDTALVSEVVALINATPASPVTAVINPTLSESASIYEMPTVGLSGAYDDSISPGSTRPAIEVSAVALPPIEIADSEQFLAYHNDLDDNLSEDPPENMFLYAAGPRNIAFIVEKISFREQ